jgi:Glycosyl hydrolase family 79 C-terminal beta domain
MSARSRRAALAVLLVAMAVVAVTAALVADRDPRAQAARPGAGSRAQAAPPHAGARARAAGAFPAALPANATLLTIKAPTRARLIPPGFLGLSLEYSTVIPYAGTDPAALDPVFVQLIRNLSPGQPPQLRIGGDSTDWAWWPTPALPRPAGVRIDLSPQWLQVTSALAQTLDARVILGINLEADNQSLAAAEASALVPALGPSHIAALELGNEPELYHSFGWYQDARGNPVPGRSSAWSYPSYIQDFSKIGSALPQLPLAGPAIGAPDWMRDTAGFVAAQPRVRIVTLHRYPLQQCGMPAASPKYPSVANILSPAASAGLADSVVPYVAAAHSHGDAIRIDEMNTVSCGGAPGVSNAFVSALWTVDALFGMARAGVDGVNIHTFRGAAYELFTFKLINGSWTAYVAPQYYGLLLFAQAAPPGSRLQSVAGTGRRLRAWATRARDGRTRVLLINDDTRHARTVAVRAPGAAGAASLERLLAPSVHATSGVTLGGQSFGSATTTGLMAGVPQITSVSAARHEYPVRLPAASAALLTLPKR